jgi:hypothetical protein
MCSPFLRCVPSPPAQVISNTYDFRNGTGRIVARLPCAASYALASDGSYMLFAVAGSVPATRATWIRVLASAGGPGTACVTTGPWILPPSGTYFVPPSPPAPPTPPSPNPPMPPAPPPAMTANATCPSAANGQDPFYFPVFGSFNLITNAATGACRKGPCRCSSA